jgi:acid ceramidase
LFFGVAPGRFAITLNAVLSDDPALLAEPIAFLIQHVLNSASDFTTAVTWLTETRIASDCLLLVTGINAGEMVVIERTLTRVAIRRAVNGIIAVTNDYRLLHSTHTAGKRNFDAELAE